MEKRKQSAESKQIHTFFCSLFLVLFITRDNVIELLNVTPSQAYRLLKNADKPGKAEAGSW